MDEPLLVGGIPTPLKNMKDKWDHYSKLNGQIKNVPNHQPDYIYIWVNHNNSLT